MERWLVLNIPKELLPTLYPVKLKFLKTHYLHHCSKACEKFQTLLRFCPLGFTLDDLIYCTSSFIKFACYAIECLVNSSKRYENEWYVVFQCVCVCVCVYVCLSVRIGLHVYSSVYSMVCCVPSKKFLENIFILRGREKIFLFYTFLFR